MSAGAGAERLHQVGKLLILRQLVARGRRHVENLPAQWQHGLRSPIARLLGRSARRVAFDDEQFGALRRRVCAVGELAGEPELAHRGLAGDLFFHPPADALLCALDCPVEELGRLARRRRKPVVEGVAHRALDQSRGVCGLQTALVLALELRLADEDRNQGGAARHHVVGRQRGRALALADPVRMVFQTTQQGGAETRFMRPAVGSGDRVAIGMDEPVSVREPANRPFDRAVLAGLLHPAGENLIGHQFLALDVGCEVVSKPAGKMKRGFRRDLGALGDERGRAAPSDLDASEQIGLRARHPEHARGIEPRLRAEYLRIRQEPHFGAAAVRRLADNRERGCWLAPFERLPVERLAARDLDFEFLRERVHDRYADAMKSA